MAAQDYFSVVQQLYVSYFGRPADPMGLQNFSAALDAIKAPKTFADLQAAVQADKANTSALNKLVNSFNNSAESNALYGTDTSAVGTMKFVQAIYQNVLGRDADPEGFSFWVNAITSGTLSKANAAAAISAAAMTNTSAQGKLDAQTVTNKLAVATAFTSNLDLPSEQIAYTGDQAAAAGRSLLNGVNSTTNVTAYQTTVNDTINGLVNVPNQGAITSFTKGLDTLAGTSGNDVFSGSLSSQAELNTISGLDTVNGGAGFDTIRIATDSSTAVALPTLNSVEAVEVSGSDAVTVNTTAVTGVTNLNVIKSGAGVLATAGATTDVSVNLKDAVTSAAHSFDVVGGNNVNVNLTDAHSVINVGNGTDVDPTGNVTIMATGAAVVNNADATITPPATTSTPTNVTMGAINVGGGKVISVTQKATSSTAGMIADGGKEQVTQGAVNITANTSTTDITVKQDAAVTARSRAAVTGATEVTSVKFTALKSGESVTVGGLTFTAAKDLTAAQVAAAFTNLSTSAIKPIDIAAPATTPATLTPATGDTQGSGVAANGVYSGSLLANWSTTTATDDTVVFTGKANTSMTDLTASTTTVANGTTSLAPTVTTQGVTAVSAQNTLGVVAGVVTIAGGAALKTVTIDGYANSIGNAGINGTNAALATVSLSNGGSFDIDSAASTLALNANNVDGTITVAAGATTINATVNGDFVATTLASASATTVNVAGTGNVVGSTATGGLTAATAINTSGMTAGTATFTINDGTVTSYTGGAASDDVTIVNGGTAATKAVDLGAGNDILTLSGTVVVPTATLKGGAGTDTIAMTAGSAATLSGSTAFADKIDGFEKLSLTDTAAAAATVNMANMDGINYVVTAGSNTASTVVGQNQVYTFNIAGLQADTGTALVVGGQTIATVAADDSNAATIAGLVGSTVTINGVQYDITKSGTSITLTSHTHVAPQVAISVTTSGGNVDSVITNAGVTTTAGVADVTGGNPFLTIDKIANNGTVELVAQSAGVNINLADATGTADSFNIVTTVTTGNLSFGTVNIAGVETIKLNASDASPTDAAGNPTIDTGSLTLNADKATLATVSGNSNLILNVGSASTVLATVDASTMTGKLTVAASSLTAMTITGGSAADTISASVGVNAKADVINGGAGNDIINVGGNGAKLTGGDGNDLFILNTVGNKQANTYSEILDFKGGDMLQLRSVFGGSADADGYLVGATAKDVNGVSKLAATLNDSTAQFSDFVNAAIKEATNTATTSTAVWFNYKGDTYVVVDNGADTDSFVNGVDSIVKLTGINGDNLSFNSQFGTLALI